MSENQHPPRRPGEYPVSEPVDLDALVRAIAEQQAEQEHGEQYADYQAALAWNQLVLDNIRIDLERQPSAACKHSRARWWITGVINQLDAVLKEGDR